MKVLVTRPDDASRTTVVLLESHGIDAIASPVLTVIPVAFPEIDLEGYSYFAITSANAVAPLAKLDQACVMSVFAVGEATAKALTAAGFTDVQSSLGNVQDLASFIIANTPEAASILHIGGRVVSGDLSATLKKSGRNCDRLVVYEAAMSQSLTTEAVRAIRGHDLDAVLHYSARTAASFLTLAEKHDLAAFLEGIMHVCISPDVALVLEEHGLSNIAIADRPEQSALIDILISHRT